MDTEGKGDNHLRRRRRRAVRPLFVLLVALLLIGLAAFSCLWKMQEREEIVSRVDPTTGYRCRFTVGADWTQRSNPFHVLPYEFEQHPANPIRQWISEHLFRRALPHRKHSLIQFYAIGGYRAAFVPLNDGYPDAHYWHAGRSVRHLKIDGCPATAVTYSNPGEYFPEETDFLICTPDFKVVYQVLAYYSEAGDATDREMQEIIRSFHVEKVDKPTGKR